MLIRNQITTDKLTLFLAQNMNNNLSARMHVCMYTCMDCLFLLCTSAYCPEPRSLLINRPWPGRRSPARRPSTLGRPSDRPAETIQLLGCWFGKAGSNARYNCYKGLFCGSMRQK
jgi:hypothetical protein